MGWNFAANGGRGYLWCAGLRDAAEELIYGVSPSVLSHFVMLLM